MIHEAMQKSENSTPRISNHRDIIYEVSRPYIIRINYTQDVYLMEITKCAVNEGNAEKKAEPSLIYAPKLSTKVILCIRVVKTN